MRQEYEKGAASRQLSQIGQVLGRQDATPESCPVWRIVILHLADATRVYADEPDASLVQQVNRVGAGRRMRSVIAEAPG
jgi:hypothetical protein